MVFIAIIQEYMLWTQIIADSISKDQCWQA